MKKRYFLIVMLTIFTTFLFPSCRKQTGQENSTSLHTATKSNCDPSTENEEFEGEVRKKTKLRQSGLNYPKANGGKAISVAEWFSLTCSNGYNEGLFPRRKEFIPDMTQPEENLLVKIRARILAAKRDGDGDYHIQIADGKDWSLENRQVIVEIPPGPDFCLARRAFDMIFQEDSHRQTMPSTYYFKNPPLVEVSGYLFLDSHHWPKKEKNICQIDGNRGIKGSEAAVGKKFTESPVQGLWEIHPVLELTLVQKK